jgi:Transposase DDE domain group 1
VDGTIAGTTGECKEGMDISHKGEWGYAPLIISLAQTREPLYWVNRSGNAPSHLDSSVWIDRSLDLVQGRFEEVWLRGDTDFSLTEHLDGWDKRCKFVLGFDARPNLVTLAQGIAGEQWEELERKPKYAIKTQERQRPENVKERIVKERGYKNIRTVSEQVAEMDYRPGKCQKSYRMVVLRKNLTVERGEEALFDDIRYFFYITNDRAMSPSEVVYFANDRCDHENDIEQLKNGVKALRMPSDDLVSNWAYMVIAALAWNLKAWVGLWMPDKTLGKQIVRMEFKRFLNTFIKIPCLIVKEGRRITYRVVGYNRCLKNYLSAFLMIKACRVT